jgi:hypothetical protein
MMPLHSPATPAMIRRLQRLYEGGGHRQMSKRPTWDSPRIGPINTSPARIPLSGKEGRAGAWPGAVASGRFL